MRGEEVDSVKVSLSAVVAVVAISSSALLVRWADAPAVVVAFWRCGLGALALAPRATGVDARPYRGRLAIAGTALAVHFWTWLASLEMTSVASSVTLATTAPVFVALGNRLRGRPVSRAASVGILAAIAGSAIIAGADFNSGGDALVGDALAIVAAAAMAVYLLAGTEVREGLGTAAYAARTYTIAAALLIVPAILASPGGELWAWSPTTWLAIGAMVLGPQLAGHTMMAALLPRLGSVTVSLLLLMEPPVAAVLAWLVLGETPPTSFWLGVPLVMAGLATAARTSETGRGNS